MSWFDKLKKFCENSIVDEIIIFAMIAAIIETIAQNSLKNSHYGSIYLILGLLFYVFVGYFLHYAYHHVALGRLNVTWSCISILIAFIIGYYLYDEKINKYNILSVIFALFGIYFAYLSSKN